MAAKGHQIVCIFPALRKVPLAEREGLSIDAVRLGRFCPILSHVWFCLVALGRFIAHYRDSDVVVVGVDTVPLLLLPLRFLFALAGKRRPKFAMRESSPLAEIGVERRYYMYVIRYLSIFLSRLSDAIFAISPMRANEIVNRFGLPISRVHVWPSSVDMDLFNPRRFEEDRYHVRKQLNLKSKFVLMYHGDLSGQRGLFELVHAMQLVRQKSPDISLLILGKGQAEQELRSQVKSSRLDGAIIFHGPVSYEEVPKFIAAADAGVIPLPDQPQWRQQVPTKLLEYLAMGKPAIATDVAGHRWIAGNSRLVYFCGRGSPTEIAEAIARCLSEGRGQTDARMRESEVANIATRFSSASVSKSVLRVLEPNTNGTRLLLTDPSCAVRIHGMGREDASRVPDKFSRFKSAPS